MLHRNFNQALLVTALAAGLCFGTTVAYAQKTETPPTDNAEKGQPLAVGSLAPALKVERWVKGESISELAKETVYVVEFWATWCGPCRTSIPHISSLAEKYKSQPVKVIGVSIWESAGKDGSTAVAGVERFVKEMGDKMKYNVAYGGDKGGMADTWMGAAQRSGVPTAFVVDKQGRIAWIGHPMAEDLVTTIDAVLSGSFDPKAAAVAQKKATEAQAKAKELGGKLRAAVQGARAEEALDVAREMFRLDPKLFPNAAGVAFKEVMVNMGKQDIAYAFAKEMFEGDAKNSPMDLNTMAWTILDDAAVKRRDLDLALGLALRAVEVTKNEDGAIIDTLARAYFDKGDKAKALELQIRAVELAKKDTRLPPAVILQLETTLKRYQNVAK